MTFRLVRREKFRSRLHQTALNVGYTFDNEGGLTNITGCDVAAPSM